MKKNFGLKVTLSAVKKTELISLDAATLDSTIFQKRIQASKKTNFSGFGINIERDLLRLAGGVPSDISFASMLIGKDSLTITSKTSPTNFLAKCSKALEFFYSNSYKQEFSFIDHITPVDNNQKNKLDSRLLNEINNMIKNNVNSNLHLIIPDIINPEVSHEISYYGTGFKKGTKHSFSSLDISDYISLLANNEELSPIKTIDVIKKNQFIYEIDNGIKNQKSKKKIYDCFVFEIKIDTSSNLPVGVYVLFSGNWYLVNTEYYNEIEKFYQKYLSKSPFLESTKMKNERELISELNNNPELLNLDQVKLNPTGINNASIEPCDFLSKKLQFIHLKDGESSGPISHLWNQGIVSSETYLSDSKFRKDLSLSISQRQKHFNKTGFDTLFPSCGSKVSSSDITIVFGIMRKPYEKSCVVGLPFFSKVSFRPVAQAIERMGYKVELHLIKKI